MKRQREIEIELIKLASGGRVIRLTSLAPKLVLQQEIDPRLPVLKQKTRLVAAFEAALASIGD